MRHRDAEISFTQIHDNRIEIAPGIGQAAATYRWAGQPKPCVHPLLTAAGHCISGYQMSDHLWHRGLWFTIKLLNGTNFWEENVEGFGIQKMSRQPICTITESGQIAIDSESQWTSGATGVAFGENRKIIFGWDDSGIGTIDFSTKLTAAQDLVLDRTPFTTWGGYGGLSFRSSREMHDVTFLTPDGAAAPALAGAPHDWAIMQGTMDGGSSRRVTIAMIDHPSNPRSPTPFYCKSGNGFNFFNAAFLFHEPMNLKSGQILDFKYRVVYRDGVWSAGEFAELVRGFRK